ncbi:MAG TPA: hypothetical protein VK655_13430 [Solirubrobacteraceae bacterium]|jgi:hypothetical protein|nr:hypothetical protein [Solirubrobacteraceae bacterium]
MPRKSLRPHLNQIRAWVRQGRTDAWVAHQLEVTVRDIEQFKRQNELVSDDEAPEGTGAAGDYPEEIDLRAEDDALIAAELEAAEAEAERARAEADRPRAESDDASDEPDEDGETGTRTRRRSRRGGRGRRSGARQSGPLEGTFDHGEEGYGLWLDPAIQENPVYAEHWAGHRPVEVEIEEDRIVIRRTLVED